MEKRLMDPKSPQAQHYWHQTRMAYIWSHLLNAPFWAIYNMLPFILYKDLHATSWQIGAMITLKPVVSIFSMYWSSLVIKRPDRLLTNLHWARFLGFFPFFFLPWVDNIWLIIAFSGLFIMMARGVVPAWMEILKLNVPEESRRKIFSYVSAFTYLGGGLLPVAFGWLMDDHYQAWRWIFPLVAFIGILGLYFQSRIPIRRDQSIPQEPIPPFSVTYFLINPWKKMAELLRERSDFAHFQIGFMIGGFGIMIWQPALPAYFVDFLNLTYTEMAVALTLCKGIGFVSSTHFWTRWMHKVSIFRFSALVTFLASLFPLCLLAAQHQWLFVYVAYLVYGVMQAGSEMSWNLSGPIFAKNEDSSVFSSVNVLMVGVRGCIGNPLGSLLNIAAGSSMVLLVGYGLCLSGSLRMLYYSKRKEYSQAEIRN